MPISTPLLEALYAQDVGRVSQLLKEGADPNAPDPEAGTWVPLKTAVEEGDTNSVVLLLRHGAHVDGIGAYRDATPLIVAALNDETYAARLLLAAGADPNARDDEGDTPLGLSRERGNKELETLLLLCGANADKT